MTNKDIVRIVYPDAECIRSQKSATSDSPIFYAIFRIQDGVPISNEWHKTRQMAWKDAAEDINNRMLRKLEL